MALSVVQRPLGLLVDEYAGSGDVWTFTNGSTTLTCATNHIQTTGSYIYFPDGQALGFWYVTSVDATKIKISEYPGASFYTFKGVGTILSRFTYTNVFPTASGTSYLGAESLSWNAVHLPIVYKLQSTLWPTNSVDTARTVSSYANDNGYVKLTLSGTLTSTVTELEFVKVTFTGGTSAIYQILTWYSNSVVTINLAYIGGITFTSVQYYYNNYHAKIRIYAGLASTHTLAAYKPYTLITEQKCVPDSTGLITININEFLKQQIGILKNDLNAGTLPNNIDAFCQFYISYAEAYDYSVGGYTLLDFVGTYTDDSVPEIYSDVVNFYAVNASLPFKNTYSGLMGDYVGVMASPPLVVGPLQLNFLTPTLYPVITSGQFFDISFINQFGGDTYQLCMRREVLVNGSIVGTFFDNIANNGPGVYRYPVTISAFNEDTIYLRIVDVANKSKYLSETKVITVGGCAFNYIDISWLNYLGGFDYWRFKSNSDYGVQIEGTTQVKKNIFTTWPKSYGAGGDTIRQETSRDSSQTLRVRAEKITMDQINDLYRIMTSPLVQIVTKSPVQTFFDGTQSSTVDRRTILPEASSFIYLQQSEKLFDLEINFVYTDNLPSQSL